MLHVRQVGALTVVVHSEHAAPRHAVVVRPLWLPCLQRPHRSQSLLSLRPEDCMVTTFWIRGTCIHFSTCRCCRGLHSGAVHADITNVQDAHGTFCSIWAARCPPRPCPAPGF